ncbi:amphi-Trp domain-containing protein [Halovivax sp.]|uniref:amphi-Trp domain-containing protein n=1 Tax=Halovivax sp. TaxID=1935978 RepID=UPI0025C38ECF|nr:amphi-Trp domain-containing protein [Halovivax sp.]
MADRTDASQELARDEVATLLRELADEFERGEETVAVPVGNKTVTLTPPDTVTAEVEVVERSPRWGSSHERIGIDLEWKG